MKTSHDLSTLDWSLAGHVPNLWKFNPSSPPLVRVAARVPGSVQAALLEANVIPDWNIGNRAWACEWVENRHWVYETVLPDSWLPADKTVRLRCQGLDHSGWVFLDGAEVGTFRGSHLPHVFDLTRAVRSGSGILKIAFDLPPRWLGEIGRTSEMTEFKTRFNYTWDWVPRLVQIGISDPLHIEVTDGIVFGEVRCVPETADRLRVWSNDPLPPGCAAALHLAGPDGEVAAGVFTSAELRNGICWENLGVGKWWPNGHGDQPLYDVTCQLVDAAGIVHDELRWRVGFRTVEWRQCEGAPEAADPWICVVNNKRIFLQGVNWPPVRPNTADATADDYRKLLTTYQELGVNILRVNGVGILEKPAFYNFCDELGLLVWQDFPLSSSGLENVPPCEAEAVREMAEIARSFIVRRQHHASLLLWCGGNELADLLGRPITAGHPMIAALQRVAESEDPTRRFLTSTPSGPRSAAAEKNFGKGLHWDVHGPWIGPTLVELREYYRRDDALFRSEIYAPGASPVDLNERYRGELSPLPISPDNPFWNRPVTWWIEDRAFASEHGDRAPTDLVEYTAWSQKRQADFLCLAVAASKDRFPGIGGVLIWCGHDCFPCPTNTSILDFAGRPKQAALELARIWKKPAAAESPV